MAEAQVTETKQAAEPKPASAEDAKQKAAAAAEAKAANARPERINPLSVDAGMFLQLMAKDLKAVQQIKPPSWAGFVKTGAHKERPPSQADWWYVRAASVLRSVARLGPVGTSKLRTRYGGKQSRGYKSERFARGSGSIIRKVLQQLEKAGLVKHAVKGVHKGRVITEKALVLMNAAAAKAASPKAAKAEKEAKNG